MLAKNLENPRSIDLILTKNPRSFQTKCVIETRLSDFHRMIISVLKVHFRKLPPKIISYNDTEKFMDSLQHTLGQESFDWSKNPGKFYEICHTILITHAPKKKKYIRRNNKPFMTKAYSNTIMQRIHFRNKFLKNTNDQD